MIDSMLFLARAQQDEMVLVKQVLPVQDEFLRLADFFEGLAEERELALACHGSGTVTAEPQLLRRALGNLLSNAIRHAAPGSTILLRSHATNEGVELSVSNLGPAIPARHLPHLFERFYRADPARSDSAASTGLGLAIVTASFSCMAAARTWRHGRGRHEFTLVFRSRTVGRIARKRVIRHHAPTILSITVLRPNPTYAVKHGHGAVKPSPPNSCMTYAAMRARGRECGNCPHSSGLPTR